MNNTERLICRECGHGFYWPPLGSSEKKTRYLLRLCLPCYKQGEPEPAEPDNPCSVEDMLEIST